MASKFEGSSRGNLIRFLPEALTLIEDKADAEHAGQYSAMYQAYEEPNADMVAGMKIVGFFGSISIVRDSATGQAIVCAGRNRVRAAREANKQIRAEHMAAGLVSEDAIAGKLVRVAAVLISADHAIEVMVSENELRRDIPPLQKAETAAKWLARSGDREQVRRAFGVSGATLTALLKLNELAPETRAAVEDGTLAWTAAVEMVGMPHAKQRTVVAAETTAATGGTRRAKISAIRKAVGKSVAPTKKTVLGILRVAETLVRWESGKSVETPADLQDIAAGLQDSVPGLSLVNPGSPTPEDRARLEGLLLGLRHARGFTRIE